VKAAPPEFSLQLSMLASNNHFSVDDEEFSVDDEESRQWVTLRGAIRSRRPTPQSLSRFAAVAIPTKDLQLPQWPPLKRTGLGR
jgi:hypothetical protein